MNYQRIYNQLISRAQSENRKKTKSSHPDYIYYEKHHIIPRCMNGSDDPANLVLLTASEHFLAHQLLIKIYPDNIKLKSAVQYMCNGQTNRINNKMFEWLRKELAKASSINNTGRKHTEETKKLLSKLSSEKRHTEETKKKMSKAQKGRKVPKGKDSPFYGIPRSEEVKAKVRATKAKNVPWEKDGIIYSIWKLAEEAFIIWSTEDKIGPVTLAKKLSITEKESKMFLKKFKMKNWNPFIDRDYQLWINDGCF